MAIPPPTRKQRLFGRVIVTLALVGGLIGGLVAVRAGKRQAAERKSRVMAPGSVPDVTSDSEDTRSSNAPTAPAGR